MVRCTFTADYLRQYLFHILIDAHNLGSCTSFSNMHMFTEIFLSYIMQNSIACVLWFSI